MTTLADRVYLWITDMSAERSQSAVGCQKFQEITAYGTVHKLRTREVSILQENVH